MSRKLLDSKDNRVARLLSSAALVALAVGCADETTPAGEVGSGEQAQVSDATGAANPAAGSLFCDALKVVQNRCQACHGSETAAGAPMSLVTYEDFMADAPISAGKKVWEVTHSRMHDARRPMPPGGMLKDDELGKIDAWVADGAKPGADPTCGGTDTEKAPEAPADWPEQCDAVYRITADNNGKGPKLKIPAGSETHPQVMIDAPWGNEDVQALGFRPITDNKKVLHHWIAYANTGGMAFLTGWAPGQDDAERGKLPPDVGMYLPKGPRSIRLDMHYYNREGTQTEEDASGVEVCVTKTPRKHAATTFMGFMGIPIIPPNQQIDIVGTCNVRVTQPVFLMTASPHAHELATHMKFTHKRGGVETVMFDGPFNFEEQRAVSLGKPLELKTGDVITTVCRYKNTTNRTVTFGENTGNEMCFNFATYYPRNALSCSNGLLGGLGGLFGGGR